MTIANVNQQPPGLVAVAVAGSPFPLTVVLDSVATLTDPVVEVTANGNPVAAFVPTISTDGDTWVLSWTADQTTKMGDYGTLPWSLEGMVNGSGPWALLGGALRFLPATTPGPSGPTSVNLTVETGGATINLTVSAAAPAGVVSFNGRSGAVVLTSDDFVAGDDISIDVSDDGVVTISTSGVVTSVVAGTGISVDDTDPANPVVSVPADTFDAYGAASEVQSNLTAFESDVADTYATQTALADETARAEAAEADLLPLAGGTMTGNLGLSGASQVTGEPSDAEAKMRLGQKDNGEMVWSWNVDQNNGDSIDDPSVGAWKFSIEAGPDYNGAEFQYSPPGDSWDGSSVFNLDQEGNLEVSGSVTADGEELASESYADSAASAAQSAAEAASDPVGSASTAQGNAETYTDSQIASAVTDQLGQPSGIATLDGSGLVPTAELPQGDASYGTLSTSNSSEQTMTVTESEYVALTWGAAGTYDGVTLDADTGEITITVPGAYKFDLDLTLKATGTGKELALGFFVNSAEVIEVIGGFALAANTQAHFSGNFATSLNVGDVVTAQVTLTDASGTLVVTDGQLSVSASVALSGDTGVASFEGRNGAVDLEAADVTSALNSLISGGNAASTYS